MNLYRDNARETISRAEPMASALPFPTVLPEPDTAPWSFRTREDFPELMNRWGLQGVGVEVGTYRGGFATCILKSWPGVLHVVDPWTYQPGKRDLLNTADIGSNEAICRNELSGWVAEGRCVIHKGFSVDVAAVMAWDAEDRAAGTATTSGKTFSSRRMMGSPASSFDCGRAFAPWLPISLPPEPASCRSQSNAPPTPTVRWNEPS